MKSTVRQGGSVKVFIIAGVILALVALGVLYGVNRFATNDQTPPLEVPERSDAVDEEAGEQSPGASNDTNDQQTSSDDGTDPFAPGQSPGDSSQDQPAASDSPAPSPEVASEASELPQTGPAETFAALTFALIAGSAVAYLRSLRRL